MSRKISLRLAVWSFGGTMIERTFKIWLEEKLSIWDHTGTQFTDIDDKSSFFTGKDGEQFIISIEGHKGAGGWSWTILTHTKDSKMVGSVSFQQNGDVFAGPKGTYSTNAVNVRKKRQGIATAMYDYFTERIGPIFRHSYQTPEGRGLWSNKHNSPLAKLSEPEQIEIGVKGYPYDLNQDKASRP